MKKAIVITLLAMGVLIVGGVIYSLTIPETPAPPRVITPSATTNELLELVNAERTNVGAGQLTVDSRLNESAQWMANNIVEREYYGGHTDPSTGKKPGLDKATELTGLDCYYIGENLYIGGGLVPLSSSIIDAWMSSSKGHREAMLDTRYTTTGIGLATTKDNNTVAVQHFCIAI